MRMLSPDKAQTLLYELQFDMDRMGVDHDGFFAWTEEFRVHRDLLITDALTEDRLVTTIQNVERAMFLMLGRLQETLYGGLGNTLTAWWTRSMTRHGP